MRATLLERAGVSRPVDETRRKRPTLFPLFLFAGTYSPLSKSVLSPVSYLRRRSSRVDGAVPTFFLPYSSLPTSVRIVSFKHSGSTFCICLILKKGMLNQFF